MFGALRRKRTSFGEVPERGDGLSLQDRALGAMALLQGDYATAAGLRKAASQAAAQRAALQAQGEIPSLFTPTVKAFEPGGQIGPTADGSEPTAKSIPYAQRRAQMPNLNDPVLIQKLLGLQSRGADIDPALEVLKANQADIQVGPGGEAFNKKDARVEGRIFRNPQVVNDTIINMNDPENEERQIPEVGPGRMLVRDAQGNPYVMDIPGYAQSEASRAGMKAGAEAGARAPYETVTGEDRLGRPVIVPKSSVTGGGPAAGQPLIGQSPAEAIAANRAAEAEADRRTGIVKAADEDAKLVPLLDDMEKLLDSGNVISGMGAELRLGGERALALAGDDRAKERVAATEAWKNLTARQVLPLVKQLGTGAGITDADRKFTEAIVAGDIELSEATMRRVIEIGRRQIEANRKRLEGGSAHARPGATMSGKGFRILSVE